MYYCEMCDSIIEEEDLPSYTQSHPYGMGYAEEEIVEFVCPYCRADLIEVTKCPICDECYIKEDEDLCEVCLEEQCTLENCIDMCKQVKEEIEISEFLASVFTPQEIEECLLKEFKDMPEHMQKQYIQKYCESDTYRLVETLEERARKNADLH